MSDLDNAHALARAYIRAADGARPGMCHAAAWTIREAFGWPIVEGTREGIPHAWNLMPGGMWFDATAEQFGDHGPQVVPPGDPRYSCGQVA